MSELLQRAMASHRAGQLEEAELLYRHILSESPRNADALHLLGLLAHQRGQASQAVALIEQAVALTPGVPIFHVNLAEAHRAAGNRDRAEHHARRAVELAPGVAEAHNNLGLAMQQAGRPEEAIAAFERAIELKPLMAKPFINLANTLREMDRRREAIAFLREGIRLLPEAAELHSHLGQALMEVGEFDEAQRECAEALRIRPDYAEGLCHQGNLLQAQGRLDDARACFQRANVLNPRLAMPYRFRGQVAQAEGDLVGAISWFRQALEGDPASSVLRRELATALYENDQTDEAIAEYWLAIRMRPHDPELQNNLGYLLQDNGDVAGGIAAYREAIRLRPEFADAYVNLGLILTEAGDLGEAHAAFREALRLNPTHPEALSGLALSLRDRLSADDFAACQKTLADPGIAPRRRAVLQYGLAQVHDARKEYARSAELAGDANAWFLTEDRERGRAYDPAEHRAYVDQILAAYSPAHFERVRGWGLASDLPIFVIGLPRSGTTLTEQILASHPEVFGGGELAFARDCYRAIPGVVGKEAPGIECVGELTAANVQQLAQQYLGRARALHPNALRIVDKMPDNYLMLGLIATLLPHARIIHMRRDLRDVALSCWLTYFRHIRWSFDPRHIQGRIADYLRLMEHWRCVAPLPMLEIDYEQLVSNTEDVARRLVQWCGLEWDPACLGFHQTRRVVRTASMVQVRSPIYQRSVKRWQNYQSLLGPLFAALPGEGPGKIP